ncbi:MAG TPA: MBL fold metallo-hydrolase [Gemmatimonadaceae bacterium]
MLLKRFYHEGLAQASYLVGSEQTGEALIVDPNRDLEQYLAAADAHALRIAYVTETHIHADFLSGARELARVTGARILLSAEGDADWQYAYAAEAGATLLHDGDEFMVGDVRVDVVHTPGHTPEHLIFVLTDTRAGDRPLGAFTGDFVFVGDVGRPDLLERAAGVEGAARVGAKLLFESLRRLTERYPDYLQLWPGHGAGSACGKSLGAVPQSTLGYEKLVNWAFQIDDEARFVEAVLDGLTPPPTYFGMMKRLNRDGPPSLRERPAPPRHPAAGLQERLRRGDLVIDLRRIDQFASAFIPGTVNIPLNRGFVGYAGWLVPYDRDIAFVYDGDDDSLARIAALELAMIGLDRVTGWYGADAYQAWTAAGGTLATIERIEVGDLATRMAQGAVEVVDVRAETEWRAGHIPGAKLAPLGQVASVLRDRSRTAPLVLVCQSGSRSGIAASVLASMGFVNVANLREGMRGWEAHGQPVERAEAVLSSG